MKTLKSVFYATIGEFSNCGSLLDFLKNNCEYLFYLDLKSRFRKDLDKTTLYIFSQKGLRKESKLLTIPSNVPEFLAPTQHVVFFVNILQAVWIARRTIIDSRSGVDLAITTFSVAALATVLAKKLGMCKKTLLWHWDYMPLTKSSKHRFLLKLVEPLDHFAINVCDHVWYASKNQFEVRKKIGQIDNPKSSKHQIVHWGNNSKITKPKDKMINDLKILYMGSLLHEKGLVEMLESLPRVVELTNGKVLLTIAGEANDIEFKGFLVKYIKENKLDSVVKFAGYAKDRYKEKLLKENHLGVALYPKKINDVKNYAYYSDPAKLRDYVSYGVPIIVSTVPEISTTLVKFDAGIPVRTLKSEEISRAISLFLQNPEKYFKGAFAFSRTDDYNVHYKKYFDSL